jgi:hypothetical protein
MDNDTHRVITTALLLALGLFVVACNPTDDTPDIAATNAAATQIVAQRLPTLEAQMTLFGGEGAADVSPPALDVTAAIATANAEAGGGLEATSQAAMTQAGAITPEVVPTQPAVTGGEGDPRIIPTGSGVFDGGDEHDTVLVERITSGQTVTGELLKAFDAHNWLFDGTAGQTATIRVSPIGQTDPVLMLLDPTGLVLTAATGVDTGADGYAEVFTATLAATGTYTIRIKGWKTGQYTLALTLE